MSKYLGTSTASARFAVRVNGKIKLGDKNTARVRQTTINTQPLLVARRLLQRLYSLRACQNASMSIVLTSISASFDQAKIFHLL